MAPYDNIFRRKSVRKYNPELHVSEEELDRIREKLSSLTPLYPDIRVAYSIVPRTDTTCKFGEYCLNVYSEKTAGYLENIGYLIEQIDLFLPSMNIGACWYGFGRTPERKRDGLPFAIMLTFGKCEDADFRQDYTKASRKELSELWEGSAALDAAESARYAPSACNSQPWRVTAAADKLSVYRTTRIRSVLAPRLIVFYNLIDMGIYLYILELSLAHFGYGFTRELFPESAAENGRLLAAAYALTGRQAE